LIKSLHLKNFKCFEDQEISFSNLTVLTGLNGAGKSSVLQALLLLRQSVRSGTLPMILRMRRLALNGELANLGTARDVLFEQAKNDEVSFTLSFGDGNSRLWAFRYRQPDANILAATPDSRDEIGSTAPLSYYRYPLFTRDFHYLQAERVGPRTYFRVPDYGANRRGEVGTRGEYAVHYLSLFGESEIKNVSLAHPRASSLLLRDQVEAWMDEICPGTRIHLTPYGDIDLVTLRYSFAVLGHASNSYRSTNVGFGITYTLPVILCLLASIPAKTLLLLENPEAHLHPKGQSRMGEMIAKAAASGVQVIAETHSDHILNGVRIAVKRGLLTPEQVTFHFLQRRSDSSLACEVSTPRIDRDGRLDSWPADFFDEWDKSLENLLESPGR
jgi:predicted ATPase